MGVTLPTFHFVGNVWVSMQQLISLQRESAMAGAAILSSLALKPSSPVALCSGTEKRRSTTLSFDICGRFNVPDTWYSEEEGACLGWQRKSFLSSDWGFKLFCWLRKKLFSVSAISTLFEVVPSLSTSRWRPQSWLSLPDRNWSNSKVFASLACFQRTYFWSMLALFA